MRHTLILSKRTTKEILRDPLNLAFGLGFPLVILGLLSAIQSHVPKGAAPDLFEISKLAPAITVFGLAFMTLFSATLISKDRTSALLLRLYTTPLRPLDYILGYLLPMVPIALVQTAICYLFGLILGLKWTPNILLCLLLCLPSAWIFIALGLLCGSVFNDKQVGGICGALLTNLTAWLSGIWFDVGLVGGAFKTAANILPFSHAVELQRSVYAGAFADAWPHLAVVSAWAVGVTVLAVWAFLAQMRKN